MTFYNEQVLKIRDQNFSDDYQIGQIIRAKQFIDHHYVNKIDLRNISGTSFFSKFYFIRLFKKYYGRTPYQYLIEVRIAKAKQLLKSGLTSAETCYSVGFDSIPSFSTLFKKITGLTTSGFLKKAIFDKDLQ